MFGSPLFGRLPWAKPKGTPSESKASLVRPKTSAPPTPSATIVLSGEDPWANSFSASSSLFS